MRDEPWLTPDQQRVWRSYLAMTAALESRIERDLQAAARMPHAYYQVLAMLSEAPERSMRMTRLAELSQMSQSRLSHAMARLEQAGWVRREPAPDDRRGQLARLTDAGHVRLTDVAPQHADTVRSIMFDGLTERQLHAFGEICDLITDRADADGGARRAIRTERTG